MKHFLLLITVLSSFEVHAQWSSDPTVNTPVSVVPKNQQEVALVKNYEGNIFVSWTDSRNSERSDIYIQSLNQNGEVRWTTNGIPVKIDTLTSGLTRIVNDDSGGVIVVWLESFAYNSRNSRIVAQRIDANGNLMWDTSGVVISQTGYPTNHSEIILVADGSTGVFVVWVTYSGGVEYDIYCQHLGGDGQLIWGAPIPICDLPGSQSVISVESDKQGGIVISWSDYRSGNMDVYAQRVGANGGTFWGVNGKVVCNEPSNQGISEIAVDEQGNSFITWEDRRNSSLNVDIYAQKLNRDGNYFWISNGVAICSLTNSVQKKPVIISDNLGGAIVAWTDLRNGSEDIYAQRINSTGIAQWTSNGIPISTRSAAQEGNIKIVNDNSGGAIMCWQLFFGGHDLLAQRVDANGTVQWAQDGIYVCNSTGSQETHQIATDEDDNLFVCWQDSRNGTDMDIYIQRVNNDGTHGKPTSIEETIFSLNDFKLYQNYPNPFNPSTTIHYELPRSSFVSLTVYNMFGQQVSQLVNEQQQQGDYEVVFQDNGLGFGTYFYCLQAGDYISTKKMTLLP